MKARKHTNVYPSETTKRCAKCKVVKDRSHFLPITRAGREGTFNAYCRPCAAERSRSYGEKNRKRLATLARTKYAKRRRNTHLLRRYGITHGDYERMLNEQGGRCAVCRAPEPAHKRLDVDHDHLTGRVRGLLCTSCNRMIGHSGDSAETLLAAAEYLKRSICVPTAQTFIEAVKECLPDATRLMECQK